MCQMNFSHIFQTKTSQTSHHHGHLTAAETALQFPEQMHQELPDQASLAEHPEFEFAQQVAFPGDTSTSGTTDSTRQTLNETQGILHSLKTLLDSHAPPSQHLSQELNQTGESLLSLVERLKQALTLGQAQVESQAAALQAELSSTQTELQTAKAARQALLSAAEQVKLFFDKPQTASEGGSLFSDSSLAQAQTEIKGLQAGLFASLRALQAQQTSLGASHQRLEQVQSRFDSALASHLATHQALQAALQGMQRLGVQAGLRPDLRVQLESTQQQSQPWLNQHASLQAAQQPLRKAVEHLLHDIQQTQSAVEALIQQSLQQIQALQHRHHQLAQARAELSSDSQLTDTAPLAPRPEPIVLLSLLEAWQAILAETQRLYDTLQAELQQHQEIESSRLEAYTEQMRAASAWHQQVLARLDAQQTDRQAA